MSIISCQECGKKISSKAPLCLHCGFQLGEVSGEQLLVFRQRRVRDRVYQLTMTSYAAMTVFLVAFGWYWWASAGFQQDSSIGPFILMGLSAAAYLWVRVLLFQARRSQKQLKRGIV